MLASASTDSSLGAPPAPERDFEAAWPAWMRAISSVTLGAAAGAAGPTERHDGASSQSFPPARFRTKYRHCSPSCHPISCHLPETCKTNWETDRVKVGLHQRLNLRPNRVGLPNP